jgi:cell division protein FtsQ
VEPTPAAGDEIPESVLRELQTVFADPDAEVAGGLANGAASLGDVAGHGGVRPITAIDDLDDPSVPDVGGSAGRVVASGDDPLGDAAAKPSRRQRRRDRRVVKKALEAARKEAKRVTPHAGSGNVRTVPVSAASAASAGEPICSPIGEPISEPRGEPAATPAQAKTIVIGGDDDLPDALYLEDVAEDRLRDVHATADPARPSGATIVIGDELDSSGAFDAVEVPTRSMDPRVRARRIAVKRAAGRRRLVWVGAALVVVALVVGGLAVFSSSLFAVEDVRIQGAPYTELYDAAQLQAVVESLDGEPILLVDTLAAERRLEQIPWIERAIVTTEFPHSVMIDVRERQPLAAFRGSTDGKYRIIDRDGRVLSTLDGQPADYMLVTGQAPDVERGALAGAPWASAAQMVAALPAEIRELTASASVDASTGDLGLILQPNVAVRIGGFAGLDAKLARLLQLVRDGLLGIVSVDVSTPEVSVTRG